MQNWSQVGACSHAIEVVNGPRGRCNEMPLFNWNVDAVAALLEVAFVLMHSQNSPFFFFWWNSYFKLKKFRTQAQQIINEILARDCAVSKNKQSCLIREIGIFGVIWESTSSDCNRIAVAIQIPTASHPWLVDNVINDWLAKKLG